MAVVAKIFGRHVAEGRNPFFFALLCDFATLRERHPGNPRNFVLRHWEPFSRKHAKTQRCAKKTQNPSGCKGRGAVPSKNQLAPTRRRWCHVGSRAVYIAKRAWRASGPPITLPPVKTAAFSVPKLTASPSSTKCFVFSSPPSRNALMLLAQRCDSCNASCAVPANVGCTSL